MDEHHVSSGDRMYLGSFLRLIDWLERCLSTYVAMCTTGGASVQRRYEGRVSVEVARE